MAWDRKAPLVNGSLARYCEGNWPDMGYYAGRNMYDNQVQIEWVDTDKAFYAVMTYTTYGRGRSAAYFIFKDAVGHTFPMFISDMDDLVLSERLQGKTVSGYWRVVKRGQNYGIVLTNDQGE